MAIFWPRKFHSKSCFSVYAFVVFNAGKNIPIAAHIVRQILTSRKIRLDALGAHVAPMSLKIMHDIDLCHPAGSQWLLLFPTDKRSPFIDGNDELAELCLLFSQLATFAADC